jgi:hypothetical protein
MRTIRQALLATLVLLHVQALAADPLQHNVRGFATNGDENAGDSQVATFIDRLLDVPYAATNLPESVPAASLQLIRQDYEGLERNQSVIRTPLTIGTKQFTRGLGTHSFSQIRVTSPEPLAKLKASIGVDLNERTAGGKGSVRFAVVVGGKTVFRSGVFRGGQAPQAVDVALDGAKVVQLEVDDAGDGPACDHADWAEARLETRGGKTLWLDALRQKADTRIARYPFSFL